MVATDYPGLGTIGPHPYLVGVSEGRAVLNSVRAAHELKEVDAGTRFAVWGHSQGGHAALWAGELAKSYAPDLTLVGVATAAPASELAALFEDDLNSLAGRILTGMVIHSWSKVFNAPVEAVVVPAELPSINKIGADCIDVLAGGIGDLMAEKKLPRQFLLADPMKVPAWKEHISKNTAGVNPPGAPVFIAQGTADTIVDPPVTVAFVKKICRHGQPVIFYEYKGVTHTKISHANLKQAIAGYTTASPANRRRVAAAADQTQRASRASKPQWLSSSCSGSLAPSDSTSNSTLTVPAFAKVRVPAKCSPCLIWRFRSMNMM